MIGNRLKSARKSLKLTQEDVAKKLNISKQAYSNYENENREVPIQFLSELSYILEVPVSYLIGQDFGKEYNDNFKKSISLDKQVNSTKILFLGNWTEEAKKEILNFSEYVKKKFNIE